MLMKGDWIGFEHDSNNRLLAVAGAETSPIPVGEYKWLHAWNVTSDEDAGARNNGQSVKLARGVTEYAIILAGTGAYWFLKIAPWFGWHSRDAQ
jgi:hypothetical protein